jgi:glutathione S-transferase
MPDSFRYGTEPLQVGRPVRSNGIQLAGDDSHLPYGPTYPKVKDMLKLYYARGTCALATHIALEEASAEFEAIRLDFSIRQQRSPEYLAVNPKGRVPALVTPQGVLTETPALLAYVAETFPKSALMPLGDAFNCARINSFNAYLCATMHVALAHGQRAPRWADDAAAWASMRAKVPQNAAECCALIEKEMFVGPWVMGDAYTVADPYLFTILGWLKPDRCDITNYPALARYLQRMGERPAVQRVLKRESAN